MLKEK